MIKEHIFSLEMRTYKTIVEKDRERERKSEKKQNTRMFVAVIIKNEGKWITIYWKS